MCVIYNVFTKKKAKAECLNTKKSKVASCCFLTVRAESREEEQHPYRKRGKEHSEL